MRCRHLTPLSRFSYELTQSRRGSHPRRICQFIDRSLAYHTRFARLFRRCPTRSLCSPGFGAIGAHGYGSGDQPPTPSFSLHLWGIFFSKRLTVLSRVAICLPVTSGISHARRAALEARVCSALWLQLFVYC